ncbi:hypothetical protein SACS_0012 [Parasaccharibacter apium]|uniref:Uncharacterized protein n=1 Tax=Parasaccharibacter apium TaxID=1510841 RepID=A0A7U7IZL6_9PROT|nr:hypothetical protein SACS_0012 [Parasaccharibacter apium]
MPSSIETEKTAYRMKAGMGEGAFMLGLPLSDMGSCPS